MHEDSVNYVATAQLAGPESQSKTDLGSFGTNGAGAKATEFPKDKDFAGTPYAAHFNFGEEQPVRLEAVAAAEPVAVLVCHGMGQQVRFETIGQIGAAVLKHAKDAGCEVEPNGVHISQGPDGFLGRIELNWKDTLGTAHQAHIYEAYWAPVTEGKVTYADTLQFLFQAAWRGYRCSGFFCKRAFDRWMFGDMRKALISSRTQLALIIVAFFLAVEVGCITFVGLRVAAGVKEVAALQWPAIHWGGVWCGLWSDVLQVLKPFLPQHEALHHWPITKRWWIAAGKTAVWLAMIGQAFFVRYFLIEYAGDVAAYISPFKDSKFDSIRTQIQAIGLNVARVIYGFDHVAGVPNYKRIVVVGHSLGSVLAYDTLNAIHNLDQTSQPHDQRHTVERTTHLITFGSPLDKTAFLFRNQSNHVADPIREQMAAGFQPLILNYDAFRKQLKWINLWSPMDIISGSLDYYDARPENDPTHVQNLKDPDAWKPLMAHTQYWTGRLLASTLFDAVQ